MTRNIRELRGISDRSSVEVGPDLARMGLYAAAVVLGAFGSIVLNWNSHILPVPKRATQADLPTPTGGPPPKPPSAEEVRALDAARLAGGPVSATGRAALVNACDNGARQRAIDAAHTYAVASGQALAIGFKHRGPEAAFGNITIGGDTEVFEPVSGRFDPRRERNADATIRALVEVGHVSPGEISRGNRDATVYVARTIGPAVRVPKTANGVTPYCAAGGTSGGSRTFDSLR